MPKVPKSKTPGFDRSKYHVDRTNKGGVQITLKGGMTDTRAKATQKRAAEHGRPASAKGSRAGVAITRGTMERSSRKNLTAGQRRKEQGRGR